MHHKDIVRLKSGRGIFNFKGVLLEQIVGGWRLLNQTASSPEQVEEIILNACSSLNESIDRVRDGISVPNNGNMATINSLGD